MRRFALTAKFVAIPFLVMVLISAPIIIVGLLIFVIFGRSMLHDYGADPPAEVFRKVFRQPLPHGVSDLVVAGHGMGQGHVVFMRFRATDEALDNFLARASRDDKEMYMHAVPEALRTRVPRREFESRDWYERDAWKTRVDEPLRIADAEYYWFDASQYGGGWIGSIAVHRERNVVYVIAQIL
ncbi:MAG: hypothetical protein JSV65_11835 [Armatimonadota bacterium]|nr:MAG: hypothetical protein JSV65_11835 [Armatimonadota bacterium]